MEQRDINRRRKKKLDRIWRTNFGMSDTWTSVCVCVYCFSMELSRLKPYRLKKKRGKLDSKVCGTGARKNTTYNERERRSETINKIETETISINVLCVSLQNVLSECACIQPSIYKFTYVKNEHWLRREIWFINDII